MLSYDGKPQVCAGSMIRIGDSLAMGHDISFIRVDQTPVMVAQMLREGEGLVEFTYEGVSVYVDAGAPIQVIQALFRDAPT
jgi:hypothetical protein